jgi:hypothetical protein
MVPLYPDPHLLMGAETIEHRQPGPQMGNAAHLCRCLAPIAVGNQKTALGKHPFQIFKVTDVDVLCRQGVQPTHPGG